MVPLIYLLIYHREPSPCIPHLKYEIALVRAITTLSPQTWCSFSGDRNAVVSIVLVVSVTSLYAYTVHIVYIYNDIW